MKFGWTFFKSLDCNVLYSLQAVFIWENALYSIRSIGGGGVQG